jgi:hypothetical protein
MDFLSHGKLQLVLLQMPSAVYFQLPMSFRVLLNYMSLESKLPPSHLHNYCR